MSVDLKRRGIKILGFGMAIEVVDRRRSGRVETMTKAKKREHGMRLRRDAGWLALALARVSKDINQD